MDKEQQELIGKMALLAFLLLIVVSIIISYACVFMSSTNEIIPNQDRHVGFNVFSGMYTQTETDSSTGKCS
jgi:hypothetical protein